MEQFKVCAIRTCRRTMECLLSMVGPEQDVTHCLWAKFGFFLARRLLIRYYKCLLRKQHCLFICSSVSANNLMASSRYRNYLTWGALNVANSPNFISPKKIQETIEICPTAKVPSIRQLIVLAQSGYIVLFQVTKKLYYFYKVCLKTKLSVLAVLLF